MEITVVFYKNKFSVEDTLQNCHNGDSV